MERKVRFLLIFLIGIILASLFVILQTYNSKQAATTESNNLKQENSALLNQLQKITQDNKLFQDKLSVLNGELDRVSKEKEELKKQYELTDKARGELLEKLKTQPAQPKMVAQPAQALPRTDDAYWAGVLKEKTELELQLQDIRNEFKAIQTSYEQLQKDSRKLAQSQQLVDTLAADLVKEKNDKIQIQDTLKLLKGENIMLKKQLKSITSRKMSLDQNLRELQKSNVSLQNKVNEMESLLNEKATYIENLTKQVEIAGERVSAPAAASQENKSSVELPPIVVRPDATATAQKSAQIEGRVLSINKENNFVIIDLGGDSGIKLGDTFRAYRDNKPIAILEAIQVRPNITACDIKEEVTPVGVGDTIK